MGRGTSRHAWERLRGWRRDLEGGGVDLHEKEKVRKRTCVCGGGGREQEKEEGKHL